MRPVSKIERTVAPFEVVSPYQPNGDQPAAIAELARPAHRGGRAGRRPARRHRHRQVRHHRVDDREAPAPHPGHGAEQDPGRPAGQRVPRAAAEQRGRVLRLVLRLLPARGVRPSVGHLHREGLLDQRGGRAAAALGDQLAAHPPRRRRGRLRLLHLRPGHTPGVRGPHGAPPRRRRVRPRRAAAPLRGHPVHAQRHGLHPRHLPRPGRHHRDLPGLRGARRPHRDVRRRDRGAVHAAPAHRRDHQRRPAALRLPRLPLRRRPRASGARGQRHREGARRAPHGAGEAGQAAGGPAAAHADHLRHRDAPPDRLLLRRGELLDALRRPLPGLPAQHPAGLLPGRLPARHRRVARHRAADRRHVRGRRLP